jgi:hypothetical protein
VATLPQLVGVTFICEVVALQGILREVEELLAWAARVEVAYERCPRKGSSGL